MQSLQLEQPREQKQPSTGWFGWKVVALGCGVALLLIAFIVVLYMNLGLFMKRSNGSSTGPKHPKFHGYRGMDFYVREPNAFYLTNKVCGHADGKRVQSQSESASQGFAGPFSLGLEADAEMCVCSKDNKFLGILAVHSPPCDVPGKPRRVGIANTGDSCFLNSAMQLLLGIPELCLALFDERNVADAGRSPVAALSYFADAYHSADDFVKKRDARPLRQELHKLGIVQGESGQEDPGEAVGLLFGMYNFPSKSNFQSILRIYNTFHISDASEDSHDESSTISVSCLAGECETDGHNEPTELVVLSLPATPHEYVTLDDMYDVSFAKEPRTDFASPLRVHTADGKRLQVPKFVRVSKLLAAKELLLNMQMETWDVAEQRVVKRADRIMVSEQWRGMTLVGFVQHLGQDNAGHYVAYKRRCIGSTGGHANFEWIKYNDDHTKLADVVEALDAVAEGKFILFTENPTFPSCESLQSA